MVVGVEEVVAAVVPVRNMVSWLKKYPIFGLSILYFALRWVNLSQIPLFNDEAIYLDWGWRSFVDFPTYLFYSLHDAKQPLFIWLVGIAQHGIENPIYAGRLVSIVFGWLSVIGLYTLSSSLRRRRDGIICAFLYITSPLFTFFDRQVLMESALTACAIWASFCVIRYVTSEKAHWIIASAGIFALGYLIKSTALLFVVPAVFLFLFHFIKTPHKLRVALHIAIFLVICSFLTMPLYAHPLYWQTLSTNTRYVLSVPELFLFPLQHWSTSLFSVAMMCLVYLNPFVMITSIRGFFSLHNAHEYNIFFMALVPFLIHILIVRSPSERYLVSFLVLLLPFSAFVLSSNPIKIWLITGTLLCSLILTLVELVSPLSFFSLLKRFSPYHLGEYTSGYTSGYGVGEVGDYLVKKTGTTRSIIAIALNAGNPESALIVRFRSDPYRKVTYMSRGMLGVGLDSYDCLSSPIPLYFVSREQQVADLNKYLVPLKQFTNALTGFTIGVWELKTPCIGTTLTIHPDRIQ